MARGRRVGAGVTVPNKLILFSFNIKETPKFIFFLNMKKKYAEIVDEKNIKMLVWSK